MRYLGIVVLVLVSLWLLLRPAPIDPAAVSMPHQLELEPGVDKASAPGFVVIASADKLRGPEDLAWDPTGSLYTGQEDGTIVSFDPSNLRVEASLLAVTGGRPLGIDFDSKGGLWVADSTLGLLSIDSDGQIIRRSSRAGTLDIGFANDVAVAPDGRIYFSDSSTRFGSKDLAFEVLESRPHGRLLRFDPATGGTEVLLDDLFFANGVAVSRSGEFVLVAETFRYRICRYWLVGAGAGTSEILVDNLPGFPDGVSANEHGTFWVAIYRPRSPVLDRILHPRPWLKRLVARLPRAVLEDRSRFGMVMEIDDEGEVLRTLVDAEGEDFFSATSVEEHDDRLYLASIEMNAIGIVSVPP